MPGVVGFVEIAVVLVLTGWLFHLVEPALRVSLSPTYAPYKWVKGKRGFGQFFKVAYECVFASEGLFRTSYEKVRKTANDVVIVPFPHIQSGFLILLPLDLIDEYVKQPENVVSFKTFVAGAMHSKYVCFGENILNNNIQTPIVLRELKSKLADKMPMMNEEMVGALEHYVGSRMDESGVMQINMWDMVTKLMSRSSNRITSGYPLCRNQEYLDAMVQYSVQMFSTAVYIRFIPPFLRPLLAPLVRRPLTKKREIIIKHAEPIIEERKKIIADAAEKGIEPELPNDLLSACMKVAIKDKNRQLEYSTPVLCNRVMNLNFLQSYSNVLSFTNVLYDLVSLPKPVFESTVAEMRAEIVANLGRGDDWSNDFVNRLDTIDAFIRESIRYNAIGEVGLERTIVKPGGFTFSTGVHVPQGAILASTLRVGQRDESLYPGGFNPERALQDPAHPKMTDISREFLNFGLGRSACPGRWFTANLLKLAFSHLLLDYDFDHLEERPQGVRKVTLIEPCGTSLVTIRKRKVSTG
ncbi:putative cytochrome P450 [Cryphonectria parasitica EP155]|uniref:Cytochrome P450 n=1 Tax=Cryphonectria parasitica (strain ATCC 38755 / EP155) TaxID=660469 RepID=A0A9P4XS80_CRYP1|nr:putative cytochrome P450 [Cryphonectria parasitica EP155]KAF3759927.1 putative cytochrome P450 [Cryphonectria parasitica EP155]